MPATVHQWPHSGTHRATGILSEAELDAAISSKVRPASAIDAADRMRRTYPLVATAGRTRPTQHTVDDSAIHAADRARTARAIAAYHARNTKPELPIMSDKTRPSCTADACRQSRDPCPCPQACARPDGIRATVVWWLPVGVAFVGVCTGAGLAIWWSEVIAWVAGALARLALL